MASKSVRSRFLIGVAALVAAAVVVDVAVAAAAAARVSSKMNSSQVVVPRKPIGNVKNAQGNFTGTLTQSHGGWKLAWKITYKDLANPVVVIADVHKGKPGHFGPILVRLCAQCHTGQGGVKRVTPEAAKTMQSGGAFITLITGKNPNGEIRGQIARG